jgi:hypothetical protein
MWMMSRPSALQLAGAGQQFHDVEGLDVGQAAGGR